MAIKMCPKCGGKVSESRDNCPHCGYIFKPTKKCPDCEEQVDFDVKECPICGHIFEEEVKEDNVAPMVAPLPVADKVNADVNNNKVEKATKDNVQTNIVGIRCPHCGSNEAVQLNEDNYQCQVCSSTFMVDKGPDTVVNGDIIINNGPVKHDVSKFDDGIIIDKTLSEKDFMLGVLKHLLEDTNTPRDIFSAKFDTIKQYQVNYILLKGHANVTYSRTLGFDRQEEYITQDNKRIEAGSWYTCKGVQKYASETKVYYVDVTKTKTVTDWRPDNGVVFGSSGGIVENSCGEKIGEKDEKQALIKASDSITEEQGRFLTSEELANYIPEKDAVERAKRIAVRNIYTSNTSSIFDHVKDEKYSGDVEIDSLSINVYPVFSVEFSLRDKRYNILSPAFGCPVPYYLGKLEFVDVQSDGAVKKALEEKFKKRAKRNIALIIATIILCAILIILTPAVIEKAAGGTVAGIIETITYIFGFGSIAALIIGIFVAKKRYEKKLRAFESQIMSAKEDDYNKVIDLFKKTGKLVSIEAKNDEKIKQDVESKVVTNESAPISDARESFINVVVHSETSKSIQDEMTNLSSNEKNKKNDGSKKKGTKNKAKRKKIAIISSISSFVIVVAILLTFLLFVPLGRQNKIINAINNRDYATAETLLGKSGNFGQSNKLRVMTQAGKCFGLGSYESGITLLYDENIPVDVSYDANGGTVSKTSETIKKNKYINNTPTKNGYSFDRWTLKDYSLDAKSFKADIELLADYNPVTYNITYNLDGGTNDSRNPKTYIIEDSITLYNPTKTCYTFTGWKLNGLIVSSIPRGTYGNITLTATWSINTYNVTVTSEDTSKGTVSGGGSYTYDSQVTATAIPNNGYSFEGWYKSGNKVSSSSSYTFTLGASDVSLEARWSLITYYITYNLDGGTNNSSNPTTYTIETPTFTLANPTLRYQTFVKWVDSNGEQVTQISKGSYGDISLTAIWNQTDEQKDSELWDKTHGVVPTVSSDGKTVTYGLYPQTHVNDSELITELNKLTKTETNGWYLYNNEYYAKVSANPFESNCKFDNGTTIVRGTIYWFKCEPIIWNILSNNNGEHYILSSVLLDAHYYYNSDSNRTINGKTIYPNNYEHSDIRSWLNNEFFNSAFALGNSHIQTTNVDNSPKTTDSSSNPYACNNTQDKVFLPSYQDYINSSYGFSTDFSRYCKTTDYARARRACYSTSSSYLCNGYYWTRSPISGSSIRAWGVVYDGSLENLFVDGGFNSVRPALTIKIA